jgi:hypothetical protein
LACRAWVCESDSTEEKQTHPAKRVGSSDRPRARKSLAVSDPEDPPNRAPRRLTTRIKPKARAANDNGKATVVVSLPEHRERARRAALLRDWAPAILATFFSGGPWIGENDGSSRRPRPEKPARKHVRDVDPDQPDGPSKLNP